MARSPGMSQALARSPGLLVSTVLTCMVGALLPPLLGLTLFVGGLALLVVLCAGGIERSGVRLLRRARALSEAEAAARAKHDQQGQAADKERQPQQRREKGTDHARQHRAYEQTRRPGQRLRHTR